MGRTVERVWGNLVRSVLVMVNPLKKPFYKTECTIHKLINQQALVILKNDKFGDAYSFFSDFLPQLNKGVVWADQDMKSLNHFYNPETGKGLYGNSNALHLAEDYYGKAMRYWRSGYVELSMFYLGAALHLVQDMSVPQHANIRLFDDHMQYESFVRRTYLVTRKFSAVTGVYHVSDIAEAIRCSARVSRKIGARLQKVEDNLKRYYIIAKFTVPLAEKTTAGCMLRFYRDVSKKPPLSFSSGKE